MMNMDNIKETVFKFLKLDSLIDHLTGYVEARVELVKIEIREEVARVLSHGLVYVAIMLFAFLFLIFFSVGLAHFINTFFTDTYVGYWILSGIYLIAFTVFIVFRKSINHNFEKHFVELIKRKEK